MELIIFRMYMQIKFFANKMFCIMPGGSQIKFSYTKKITVFVKFIFRFLFTCLKIISKLF